MLHTLISYLSRFSRLVLLTFAFVVILILVLFTIDSATNEDTSTVDSAISASISEGEIAANQNFTYDESPDKKSLVIINTSSASISTDTVTGNPQTFIANTINLDSDDTITIITTNDGTSPVEEDTGFVSSTITTLPNTGISSTATVVIGLMALSAGVASYLRSKKNLSYELLEANR